MSQLYQDPQQEIPASICDSCKGEIYHGEPVFISDGKRLCLDCLKSQVTSLLEDDPRYVALMMGIEVLEV